MSDSVEVYGLQELGKNLDVLGQQTAKNAVRAAIKPAAEVFRRAIRANAPVRQEEGEKAKDKKGGKRGPGYLKAHIGRWIRPDSDGSLNAFVGPTPSAFYGKMVEKGHRNVRTKAEARAERYGAQRRALVTAEFGGKDTPPHPFMRPAFDGNQAEAERVFADELWKQIEAAFK